MSKDKKRICKHLKGFEFVELFNYLGWDNYSQRHYIEVDGHRFQLDAIAEKRAVQAYVCSPDAKGRIPSHPVRKKIDNLLLPYAHEHLIIFVDSDKNNQLWQWMLREPGHNRVRTIPFNVNQFGESLIQNLLKIRFTISEEEAIGLGDVTYRLKDAWDRDKVTKKFFDLFSKQRDQFEKFISGIPDEGMNRWYVSVMLNRLMFIYFIQKKGFLDGGDEHYLKNRLNQVRSDLGKDVYYKQFICPLFFGGFAEPAKSRDAATNKLLGKVPYLNGGLFMKHQLERLHGREIDIKDAAFTKLFEFFDEFDWHLDETAMRSDNEINPDVLGYIFEKYINQKQMGAYYTKEDITGYISQNTIIPFLLQRMQEQCPVAFEPKGSVWDLLKTDPDRYIYDAVYKGVVEDGKVIPESALPDFVQAGMHDPKERMFEKRYNLGLADPELALPTETWREYIERRKRCIELRDKLAAGEVTAINDLITYNLNIRQFALDVVQQAGGTDLINACWIALNGKVEEIVGGESSMGITVLDPTVGSGAFLFSALEVLYPLYESCLDRMAEYVQEKESLNKQLAGDIKLFKKTIQRIDEHPNREYFILKSIVVDNLFGVDIMEEACEICKLRMFLKLVSQIEDVSQMEPLPDIDFNIRAGNTLVGFANEQEVETAMRPVGKTGSFDFDDALPRVKASAGKVADDFKRYRWAQVTLGAGSKELSQAKESLTTKLDALRGELDQYLCRQYGIDAESTKAFQQWHDSHKPFHWWAEFYGIISKGGFDVIIGNPPYVEYSKVRKEYEILPEAFSTIKCGNLYANICERCQLLLGSSGMSGVIILLASFGTKRMLPLQQVYRNQCETLIVSHYEATSHPSVLFVGVEAQLSIVIGRKSRDQSRRDKNIFTSNYIRTYSDQRESLFKRITYIDIPQEDWDVKMPRISDQIETNLLKRVRSFPRFSSAVNKDESVYFRSMGNFFWKLAFTREPKLEINGIQSKSTTLSKIEVESPKEVMMGTIYSSMFYWWWSLFSDVYHLTKGDILSFPLVSSELSSNVSKNIKGIADQVQTQLFETAKLGDYMRKKGRYVFHRFFPHQSKPIIDKIDIELAKHYGFTDEELDFIINYDIKYRMGRGALIEYSEQSSEVQNG